MSILIVCAGSSGQFCAQIARDAGTAVAGFLDDNLPGVLGPVERLRMWPGQYVVGLADPAERYRIVNHYGNDKPGRLIHPTALIGSGAAIGAGSVIGPYAVIGTGALLGEHCVVNTHASIAQGSRVGDFCTVSPGARISGDNVLGEGVFVGTNACTRDHLRIDEWATVGCGAAVVRDVACGVTVKGVPAR